MKINHLSVSRTGVWSECQLKYKYKYHMGLPSQIAEPPYLVYGKAVHKIIETFCKSGGKRDINEIKNEVVSGQVKLDEHTEPKDLEAVLPLAYLKRFKPELDCFLKLSDKLGVDGKIEWGFEFDLEPPNNKLVHGVIDRLIQRDDKFIIIDYKTTKKGSKWRKTRNDIVHDLQLQCYTKVVADHFNTDPKNIRAALYYLGGGELIGATFSAKTIEAIGPRLLQVYNSIADKDPALVRGTVGDHCNFCEYAKICPFVKLRQSRKWNS